MIFSIAVNYHVARMKTRVLAGAVASDLNLLVAREAELAALHRHDVFCICNEVLVLARRIAQVVEAKDGVLRKPFLWLAGF